VAAAVAASNGWAALEGVLKLSKTRRGNNVAWRRSLEGRRNGRVNGVKARNGQITIFGIMYLAVA